MPRIADSVLDSAVYLYYSADQAERGERAGGTGFLTGVLYPSQLVADHKYVVTNRHVVESGGAAVMRMNTQAGMSEVVPLPESGWEFHPGGYDVAVCEVRLDPLHLRHRYVQLSELFTDENIREHGVGVGEDVFMVGRYITSQGIQRNTPVVRQGHIAMMPQEELVYEDSGHTYRQLLYLLEIRSIPGFSGSPVFVHAAPVPIAERPREWAKAPKVWEGFCGLLGIECAAAYGPKSVIGKDGKAKPNLHYEINEGMSWAVPASRILEVLNMPRFSDEREAVKKKRAAVKPTPGVKPTSATAKPRAEKDENQQAKSMLDKIARRTERKP